MVRRNIVLYVGVCLAMTFSLVGCPPARHTDVLSMVAPVTTSQPCFLAMAREQPLTAAEAALLHIVESNCYTAEKLQAAQALAEIEKTRINTQSREMSRRLAEVERR